MRAARHFFRDVNTDKFSGKLPRVMRSKLRPKSREVLDRYLDDAIPKLRQAPLGPVYDQLLESRTSMYARATGHELSQIGASMLARWLEGYRIQSIHQLANSSARDVYQRALSGGFAADEVQAPSTST
jgi:hypothetical protein